MFNTKKSYKQFLRNSASSKFRKPNPNPRAQVPCYSSNNGEVNLLCIVWRNESRLSKAKLFLIHQTSYRFRVTPPLPLRTSGKKIGLKIRHSGSSTVSLKQVTESVIHFPHLQSRNVIACFKLSYIIERQTASVNLYLIYSIWNGIIEAWKPLCKTSKKSGLEKEEFPVASALLLLGTNPSGSLWQFLISASRSLSSAH